MFNFVSKPRQWSGVSRCRIRRRRIKKGHFKIFGTIPIFLLFSSHPRTPLRPEERAPPRTAPDLGDFGCDWDDTFVSERCSARKRNDFLGIEEKGASSHGGYRLPNLFQKQYRLPNLFPKQV